VCIRKALALLGLCRGMIYLKHAQGWVRIPIRESIKAGSQHHVLSDPSGNGLRECVLRHPTPDRQKCAQRRAILEAPRLRAHRGSLCVSQDRECERIIVNAGIVQQLMGSASYRDALCCSTRSTLNHAVAAELLAVHTAKALCAQG